jgi:Nif-specific regulatory protein
MMAVETMNPTLIILAGPLKGTTFTLSEAQTLVGRETGNSLRLDDPSVSRQHCLIKRDEDDVFKVMDLDSFNGTFVNDVPIKEQRLNHGDQITVGDTLLLFLTDHVEGSMNLNLVQLDQGRVLTRSAARLRKDEALYLNPSKLLLTPTPPSRLEHDLNLLLEISTSLNAIRDFEPLQQKLLESVLKAVPAERAAIILLQGGLDDVLAVYGKDRNAERGQNISVSRTVASQVLNEGIALLSNDVLESEDYEKAESLLGRHTRALACVPLAITDRIAGLIYVDTSDPSGHFDEGHLQLLMGVAGIASIAFENVLHFEWLTCEKGRLEAEIGLEHDMVGESERMQEVYNLIARAAAADSTVLIRGESGTGKELAARALHRNSLRCDRPFIAINCAALAEQLLESELFGHERGAFTGAIQQKKGKLEVAEGGTIFLDEVGEMSDSMQAKLLRVLQEREFERVGGTRTISMNVRIVAATNRDLKAAITAGRFRADLYYRLNVIAIEMPPLRERKDDIPLLATYFLSKFGKKCNNRRLRGIAPEARLCLVAYDWPGNVRELENAIERAVVLGLTDQVQVEDLPEELLESVQPVSGVSMTYHEAVKEAKKQIILKALEQAGRNYAKAARNLGVHPNNLHRIIRSVGLRDGPRE